ncbi:DUF3422 family protein [Oceanospirillum sediminis]|uniref:DUF3422 domain-containing protein n=1 Tax=Oceanospirillum sediminis TaxID=2760088 RepID=A0A839IIF9_9GAMM|nr:DUF3422 domain-containing protein [Oceanospirillum sediminis]MBB1485113.1 DUF3422 domain-containing protein [Oceanospirillum sediminis]
MSAEVQSLAESILPFNVHPRRDELYNELHARPFPVVQTPARVSRLAVLLSEEEKEQEFAHLQSLCQRYGVNMPAQGSNFYQADFGGFQFRCGRHMEFVTYTFIRPGTGDQPFDSTALELIPQDWLKQLPGQVVAAFHVEMLDPAQPKLTREQLKTCFEGQRLVNGHLMDGGASVWSAFRLHGDGFGRFLVHNRGLNNNQTGRLLQRLLELETYRLMGLLALPEARRLSPELQQIDRKLATIIANVADLKDHEDERRMLKELSMMAAMVERWRTDTNYRFSAMRAYYALVMKRMDELKEQQVENYFTISSFLERRLTPAYHTCESVSERLEDLARRIERAGDLLQTRVDLTIEAQNQDLLTSMDRRGRLQMRLQETVEGLSIAAISYYTISLVKIILNALYSAGVPVNKDLATGIAVPVVIALVWWVTHRIKQVIMNASKSELDELQKRQGKTEVTDHLKDPDR